MKLRLLLFLMALVSAAPATAGVSQVLGESFFGRLFGTHQHDSPRYRAENWHELDGSVRRRSHEPNFDSPPTWSFDKSSEKDGGLFDQLDPTEADAIRRSVAVDPVLAKLNLSKIRVARPPEQGRNLKLFFGH